MVRFCVVFNCGSREYTTILKNGHKRKLSFFRVPKNSETRDEWNKVLGCEYRQLRENDIICEKHFKKEDIKRNFVVHQADGTFLIIPRKIAKLEIGSIPCHRYNTEVKSESVMETNGKMNKHSLEENLENDRTKFPRQYSAKYFKGSSEMQNESCMNNFKKEKIYKSSLIDTLSTTLALTSYNTDIMENISGAMTPSPDNYAVGKKK